jgi:hypothetical protein
MSGDLLSHLEDIGLLALPIPVPPQMEEALGYPGKGLFIAFHEWRQDKLGFYIDDAHCSWQGAPRVDRCS